MKFRVFDTESDGLAYECTKIHILSYTDDGSKVHHTDDYGEMKSLLSEPDVLWVAHNSCMHDMVVFNRILGLGLTYQKFVDTLMLSWFLQPDRKSHGLGSYTKEAGVEKPHVNDWQDVTWEQMKHRCESDVLINWWLWQVQKGKLEEIYG